MLTRTRSSSSATPAAADSSLGASNITVQAARDRERAEPLRDLVDAHRRLQGSVLRFLSLFVESVEPAPLDQLVACLEKKARAAGFARMPELSEAVQATREAARQREWLFSDSFGTDAAALREAARALERLDATLVGLCVEHVVRQTASRGMKGKARRA
ncbi:hypothetical protein QCE63_20900 [Caballeronia sp. LZ065]|uniref:hypothetical protein n=1 Tax=Caballeronia sp. LZ065 TaxID=3038571 RepID=UPI002867A959|nr:hypothetical protein [Caballeronia sp. LZ065]MDR5781863.1 hypothetical protein [Caballeronia sp. LZ065]